MATDLSSALGTFNFGGILGTSGLLAYILIIILLIGLIVYMILYIQSFKDTLIIKEPIGNTFNYTANRLYKRVKMSAFGKATELEKLSLIEAEGSTFAILPYMIRQFKCKIIIKRGVSYLKAFRVKRLWKIPDQAFQATTSRGRKYFELTKLSEHIYAPSILVNNHSGETGYIYDESIFQWVINDIENDHKKYMKASFWDKYGNLITILAVLIVVLIVIVVTLKYSNEIVQNTIKAVQPLAQALVDATKQLTVQQIASGQVIP